MLPISSMLRWLIRIGCGRQKSVPAYGKSKLYFLQGPWKRFRNRKRNRFQDFLCSFVKDFLIHKIRFPNRKLHGEGRHICRMIQAENETIFWSKIDWTLLDFPLHFLSVPLTVLDYFDMSGDIRLPPKWIELNINKRECNVFIPSLDDSKSCQCGREASEHPVSQQHHYRTTDPWLPSAHTKVSPTDAYGTIIFEGEHHPNKSHYVRLSHDTNPEIVVQMMSLVWGLPMPKLIISVRGSNMNFELNARLGKILQSGLLKAAKTTDAWIFTNGLNRGVAKHVGMALGNQRLLGLKRGRVVSIGICPFGIVQNHEDLIGRNKDRIYNPLEKSASKFVLLNPRHANFLLVDNGSVGKSGGESVFRRRLERCITSYPTSPNRGCNCPIVCLVIGGSFNTLRCVTDYLYDEPPVPVVVFSGTGITADLIAITVKRLSGSLELEDIREEVYSIMIKWYSINRTQCGILFEELRKIVGRKHLVTIYNPSVPDSEPFDTVLLASLFRSQHWTPLQQLSLTLVWDRVDIATREVFFYGRDWSRETLEHAMMEALSSNRLDFVELLIEHGLNVQIFLTPKRLEELYSFDRNYSIVMRTLLFELSKLRAGSKKLKGSAPIVDKDMTLHEVGFAMSHMMGHVYKSRYSHFKNRKRGSVDDQDFAETAMTNVDFYFKQPFDDLFIWAVLTKRHSMAVLLWKHGVGALAKALVALKLNIYLVDEFKSAEKTETNLAAEFQSYADEWEELSYSLLDSCFKIDSQMARQLLTMELEHWSKLTCLILAVTGNHRMLLAHPCCQILLADMWMGALSHQHTTIVKVLGGIIFPPIALCCDFKTRQELKLLPHQSKKEGNQDQNPDEQRIVDDVSLHTLTKSVASVPSSVVLQKYRNFSEEALIQAIPSLHALTTNRNQKKSHQEATGEAAGPVVVETTPGAGHRVTIIDDITSSEESEGETNLPKHKKKSEVFKDFARMGSSFITTSQDLSCFRKLYEFQKAPMTNFYRHTMGYLVFLVCLTYVILVPQDPVEVGWVELYTVSYLLTFGLDILRDFITGEGCSWAQKWSQFLTNNWSLSDVGVVMFSLTGSFLRFYPTSDKGFFNYGMLIYKVASIYWNLRLYKYLSNHRWVGPKLVMMKRMLKHMIYFVMIILVVLIAFGISREAIRFPDTYPTWRGLKEAFLEPYVMFYGEIDIDSLSPHCDEDGAPPCPIGHFILPVTWAIYMMVANILIVNVVIAVFNGVYEEVDGIAMELWMFQRFSFVMEFQSKPLLPPPFIILCHFYYIMRAFFGKCRSCFCEEILEDDPDFEETRRLYIGGNDRSLKTFLTPAEASQAFDFEEDNVEGINTTTDLSQNEFSYRKTLMSTEAETLRRGKEYPGHLGTLETLENRHFMEMYHKITDVATELDDQKSKLDRIIAILEEDENI